MRLTITRSSTEATLTDSTSILLVLDALAPVKKNEIDLLMPGRSEPLWLRLAEHLGVSPGSFTPPMVASSHPLPACFLYQS